MKLPRYEKDRNNLDRIMNEDTEDRTGNFLSGTKE
jgi:hypothetical protein